MSELITSMQCTRLLNFQDPLLPPYDNLYQQGFHLFHSDFSVNRRFDGKLCFDLGGPVTMNNIETHAVIWANTFVSIYPLPSKTDVVSFNFEGCVMAVFEKDGVRYAAHIHMPQCKREWCNYLSSIGNISNLVMFRPDYKRNVNTVGYDIVNLMGVITPYLKCYSVCLKLPESAGQTNLWNVEFIEKHDAPFTYAAYDSLLDPTVNNLDQRWNAFWDAMTIRDVTNDRGVDIRQGVNRNGNFYPGCNC